LKQKQSLVEAENSRLRSAIHEQILDEKLNILKISRDKLNTYFNSTTQPHYNKLYAFERESQQEVNRLVVRANKSLQEEKLVQGHMVVGRFSIQKGENYFVITTD